MTATRANRRSADHQRDPASHWPVWICWAYALLTVAAAFLLWTTGDRWWLGTLICFGPRWPLAVPAPLLILLARRRWRSIVLPMAISSVALTGWLGVVISFGLAAESRGPPFRVITFNTQGGRSDFSAFAEWALAQRVDVIVFQETSEELVKAAIGSGWHLSPVEGGVLIASRHPIRQSLALSRPPGSERIDCLCVDLEVDERIVRVGGVHLPTPRDGLEAFIHRDRRFIAVLAEERRRRETASRLASEFLLRDQRVDVLAGDFNLPVDSDIYREHWSEATNAFNAAGMGFGYTKRTRWHGVRIDHILVANPNVAVVRATVGPEVNSDHRPVFGELALPAAERSDGGPVGRR
jgi:vancomycin resistance protein VanJ